MLRKFFVYVALALLAVPAAADKKLTEAPSVNQVIAKHLEAQGGLAKLKAIQSVSYAGTETFDGKTAQIASTRARPNMFRFEHTEGKVVSTKAFDGTAGWYSEDGSKVETIAEGKLAGMRAKSQFDDVLVDPAARGAKVALEGTVMVNGAPAYALLITMENGDLQKRLIDTKSWLEVKRVSEWSYNGKPQRKVATFKDYKTISGITAPITTEYERDGKKGVMSITRIEYDTPVSTAMFAAPAGAQSAVPAATAGK